MSGRSSEATNESGMGLAGADHGLAQVAAMLVRSELEWMGRGLLRVLRLRWHDRAVRTEHATTRETRLPTGPFRTVRKRHVGDLLLWVPRGIDSYLIDDLTGGYGYSHATIDTGEIDVPSGKPVMAEITVGQTVTHKFQDEYGQRPFVRIPLARAGVNVQALADCVETKMGQRYDSLDVLTLGEIDDPAKEVCSGLVADCLPEDELRRIAQARRLGLLQRHSVSVHSRPGAARVRAFVSPNALAEYYGAPQGRKVSAPNTLVAPRPAGGSVQRMATLATRHHGWKVAAALLAAATMGLVVRRVAGGRR